jgi:cell division protein FtsW (lipid II flippase)
VPDIGGLPLHPLIVHAAVVLVPLAAVGAVLMALWPRFSRRFGVLVVIVAVIAALSSWLARVSGGTLAETVQVTEEHSELGHRMPIAAIALAVIVLIFWLFDRGIPGNRRRPWWLVVLAVVLVVIAVAATYVTVLTGHSGAEAVWLR